MRSQHDLRRRIRELGNQCLRLGLENADLRRDLAAAQHRPGGDLDRVLADAEMVELHRAAAWASQPNTLRHWDDEAGGFVWPEGWPEGMTAESYIAERLGVKPRTGQRMSRRPAGRPSFIGCFAMSEPPFMRLPMS